VTRVNIFSTFDRLIISRVDFEMGIEFCSTLIMKKKYLIGGVIVLAAVAYLLYLNFGNSVSYYVTVSEFYARSAELSDTNIRVAGKIMDNSIQWDAADLELKFEITEGGKTMPVVYKGAEPAGFKGDSNLLVEGKYGPGDVFRATQLILKCPSKYESIDLK
jgi:cytochrome c-type biogenesis protein CcmE